MNERNLVITGMMGSGKSSVAPLVAQSLNRTLIDTDREIEKKFAKTIEQIFEEEGEAVFRKEEAQLCAELSERDDLVIATGGGFLVPFSSLALMQKHSVFCLDASLPRLIERAGESGQRPLLGKISRLFAERQSSYQQIFHHVDTNHQSVAQVAEEIVTRFKLDISFRNDKTRLVRMPLQAPYPVIVKNGIAFEIEARLLWAGVHAKRVLVITNEKLKSLYASKFHGNIEWILMPDGEQHKTLATVHELYAKLLSLSAKRDDVIVAFGGGVVGDVAGYVAATYMRGLKFVQIPTTLLAMVDSSIGGKTGVDLPEGKNLIGAFKQPFMVLTDPLLLKSLPEPEYNAGMAEVVKSAIINDESLFAAIEKDAVQADEVVYRALCVKADIVEEDPFEQDRRALLNLGHTFGHAFEKVSNYQIRHGEAVSLGMVAACELARRLSLCDIEFKSRVAALLSHFGLPTKIKDLSIDAIMAAFKHDKKSTSAGLRFVLPHGFGDVRVHDINDESLVREVLLSL